ncbi:MAG: leucine-rich repeat domain-containing protein [Holosporales bacterium]|jgi:hypothetical protein|nr:leucine-rich repeat domain-containing protein [Holosporales bacterium]
MAIQLEVSVPYIPPAVDIGPGAFESCRSIEHVIFDRANAMTELPNRLFSLASGLSSITIPAGVTDIRDRVFNGCRSLSLITWEGDDSVDLSDRIDLSGRGAAIPASVNHIGQYAFAMCRLKLVVFAPRSALITLERGVFKDCFGLESFVFPSETTIIEREAFCSCTSLREVDIPAAVEKIEDGAFKNCNSLSSVTFGPGSPLHTIGLCAFQGCSSLRNIDLPGGLQLIDDCAFEGCRSLAKVTGWERVRIRYNAFEGCHPELQPKCLRYNSDESD